MKKFFSFALILALLISIFPTIPSFADNSIKTYTVKIGKKISLKTDFKNPTWGSSDTSVATVTQKGKVKGISAGECNIVAV